MRAVRSTPPGVTVVDVDEPDGPGELIAIRSASICASDFGYIQWGSQFVLGHELSGVTGDGRAVAIEAIFGGGAIGLMAVAAAQAMGAAEVSLEARYPHQKELGERLGATETSGQYDVVIEAAGSESSLYRCTELARPGGTMGVLGVFGP